MASCEGFTETGKLSLLEEALTGFETESQDWPATTAAVAANGMLAGLTETVREAGSVEAPLCQANASDVGVIIGAEGPRVVLS